MRSGCQTVISVIKVNPQANGVGIKSLVNMITIDSEHFGVQALGVKKEYMKYLPKYVAVDANGLGVGLMDYLVTVTEDRSTGEVFPAFGVANDEKRQYRNIDTGGNVLKDVIWMIKANADINSEGYTNVLSQMGSGKLRFLTEERVARGKLMETKRGQDLSTEERVEELRPYVLTSILKEELLNLTENKNSRHFRLEGISRSIGDDKVSALMYGLYVIKIMEDEDRRRKKGSVADMMFFG